MTIPNHQTLTAFSAKDRRALAQTLRETIIETVTRQGGHLSSSLGAVELIVALHTVFDFRYDRVVFDVGHQAYAHKLLTGRLPQFRHLREKGGASGFPRREESDCDAFTTGHASTALSAALGMAYARDVKGEKHAVVAVVGDGALTGGMCYEALNELGQRKTPFIVIVNDNDMSIARNVGALSRYLSGLRQSIHYNDAKEVVRKGIEAIPLVGAPIANFIKAIKRSLRALLIGEEFFESLGLSYYGPIDGHNTEKLIRALTALRAARRPVLLHIVTKKGKGYPAAEKDPSKYHGVSPANEIKRPRYGDAVSDTLCHLADTDARVAAITAAMPGGTGLTEFARRFPARFFDTGIAEEHAVTMAAGMAASGLRPFVCIYSTFLQRAYDQLLHDVCLPRLPVTILIDRAGMNGQDGATHQGLFDLSLLLPMPNMVIAAPKDKRELAALIRLARDWNGPFAIRYPKDAPDADLPDGAGEMRVGAWETLAPGGDVTILAVGRMAERALRARELLQIKGVQACVVNACFVKPLDDDCLLRVAPLVVTVEDNALAGGFGEAVRDRLSALRPDARVIALGAPDRFIEHATADEQLAECGLTPEGIRDAALAGLNKAFL